VHAFMLSFSSCFFIFLPFASALASRSRCMPGESRRPPHPSHPSTWCLVVWETRGHIVAPGRPATLSSDRNGGWVGLKNCMSSTVRAAGTVVVDDQAHLNAREGRQGHVICGASLHRARLECATPQAPSHTRYLTLCISTGITLPVYAR
jgi:hypothetical protein